ncbi:MAG: chemotaxis protein CheV [Pseudomonadales bacterium]
MTKELSDSGILLESGTNEFEVLIFNIGDQSFGVNVAKIRELIMPTEVTACPGQPAAMLGMISLRGKAVTLINLHEFFSVESKNTNEQRQCIIVTEFSRSQSAFLADSVEQIIRASWSQIQPVPELGTNTTAQATGILHIDQRLIPMIDFESIYSQLFHNEKKHVVVQGTEYQIDRSAHKIYMAEDSVAIRAMIENTMMDSGYTNLSTFSNGQDCWNQLQSDIDNDSLPAVVITDIEMPLMDGLALTRNIKDGNETKHIPVILFSSLVSEDNHKKGEQVGANEQLSKPMIVEVVEYTDKWISLSAAQASVRAENAA